VDLGPMGMPEGQPLSQSAVIRRTLGGHRRLLHAVPTRRHFPRAVRSLRQPSSRRVGEARPRRSARIGGWSARRRPPCELLQQRVMRSPSRWGAAGRARTGDRSGSGAL